MKILGNLIITREIIEARNRRLLEEEEHIRAQAVRNAEDQYQIRLQAAVDYSRIPDEYLGVKLDQVRAISPSVGEALRQVRLFVENFSTVSKTGTGFCFYGAPGTGKTMLACAMLNALMPDVRGMYVPLWELIEESALARSTKDYRAVNVIKQAPLLVIDEVGVQNGNTYEEGLILPIFDSRKSALLPTVFISNLAPDVRRDASGRPMSTQETIRQKVGYRIFERIRQRSVFLMFKGESQRKRVMSIDEVLAEAGAVRSER